LKILSRYVGMQFLRLFLVSLFAFLSVYLIVEFFERIDDFPRLDTLCTRYRSS
jgi:lipopolysaccharide export LptBFGC system permease protein LptF